MQNAKQHSIVFNYPENLLFSLKLSEKEFEKEFKTAAVVKLYERGKMPERKTKTVVSNTTPLITLAIIDKLDILRELYGKVYIPNAVLEEIKAGKGKIGYFEIETMEWIIPQKITNEFSMNYLIDLDDGEAETIILAEELQADIVLIDEKLARGFAEMRGLTLSGSLGFYWKQRKGE